MDSRVECFWGSKTLRLSCDQTINWNCFSAPSSSWSPLISSNHSYHHDHHHYCYPQQDILSQIRQLDYLLSKAQDIKIADRSVISFLPYDHDQTMKPTIMIISRESFEDDFEDIKDLISAKTLFAVDDAITQVWSLVIKFKLYHSS